MIAPSNNKFVESESPHSMGLFNDMTVPSAGLDSMANLAKDKLWSGSPVPGMSGLSFDGSGFLGTGLFSGDISNWGIPEVIGGLIGVYAVYSMIFQGKQTNYRLQQSAHRRRKVTAAKLKARATELENKEVGGWF